MINNDMPIVITMGLTNCNLIKCQDGFLVIDTSFTGYFEKFLKDLKKYNINPSEIKFLLLTHHHDDHTGFAAQLKELTGCRIIAHKNAVEALGERRNDSRATSLSISVWQ